MKMEMKKDEFDGSIRIHSDQPLELQSTVGVTNLKGEQVQRFIVSLHRQLSGEFIYDFAKDRQAWLDKEAARREKLEERREARRG